LKIKLYSWLLLSGEMTNSDSWGVKVGSWSWFLLFFMILFGKKKWSFSPFAFPPLLIGFSYLVFEDQSVHIINGSILLLYHFLLVETGVALNCGGLWMSRKVKSNWGIFILHLLIWILFQNKNELVVGLVYWINLEEFKYTLCILQM